MYKCSCGKEFDSFQKFNGHRYRCLDYATEFNCMDKYNKTIAQDKNWGKKLHEDYLEKENADLELWISAQHTCEHCNKIMTVKFGTGRFCSKACASSHIQTDEINAKRSKKLKKTPDYFCLNCGKKLFKKAKTGYCADCYHKCVPVSEETRKKIHDKKVGTNRWNIHRNQTSYAEKFFIDVLNDHNISFEHEFQVKRDADYHCYYLDFLINNKIDLEIDGAQHQDAEHIKHDTERDDFLKSIGYIIYRIPWNNINTENGKKIMGEKINNFLLFLDNYNQRLGSAQMMWELSPDTSQRMTK